MLGGWTTLSCARNSSIGRLPMLASGMQIANCIQPYTQYPRLTCFGTEPPAAGDSSMRPAEHQYVFYLMTALPRLSPINWKHIHFSILPLGGQVRRVRQKEKATRDNGDCIV